MTIQIRVAEDGVLIPKSWLGDSVMIEVQREDDRITLVPVGSQARKTLVEIQTVLLELKPLLQKQYRVTTLGIFGSYARHEQRWDSDVDILIDYVQAPSLVKVVQLRDDLSERLGLKVDVVTMNGLRADIKDQVLSDVVYLWNAEA